MNGKKKFPFSHALAIAREIKAALEPACTRIQIAGSLRRHKPEVGDIEILFVPKTDSVPADLFSRKEINLAWEKVDALVATGMIGKRPNVNGHLAWGDKNRLAVHIASGIPVDFFCTGEDCWWNALVVRTGGKDNNVMIARRSLEKGWRFEAYGSGFQKVGEEHHYQTTCEQDIYRFLGLSYVPPERRK